MRSDFDNLINEETLRAIFNNALDGMVVINDFGIIQTTNEAVTKMFQFSEDELTGKNISILMPEPDRTRHDSYLGNYKKTGDRKIIGIGREVIGRRKDGSTFPFYLSICEVEINNGGKLFAGVYFNFANT